MTKNTKIVILAGIGLAVLVVVSIVGRDMAIRLRGTFDCGDGPRRTIDIRDFTTKYSAYSVELETSVANKAKIATRLNPVQQQQLSEATNNSREFRKYVVAGFNSCAVSKAQFAQFGATFQALDSLAREIDNLTRKPSLSEEETAQLAGLISQYGGLVHRLGTPQS